MSKLWAVQSFEPISRKRNTWALVGGAVIGGVAGFGGAALSQKKKTTALPVTMAPTLSDTPEYSLYRKTLEDRMAGLGTGYDQKVLDAATNPYAAQVRTNFAQNTVPAISSQASARGLGRSTIPVNEISRASQGVEQDIGTQIANLQLANEAEKASEKSSAISGYGELMGNNYNSLINLNATQNKGNLSAWNTQNINDQIAYDNQQNMIKSTIGGAMSGGTAGAGGGSLGLLSSIGGSLSNNSNQNNVNNNQSARSSAMVNVGNDDLMIMLKNLLAGNGNVQQIGSYSGYRTS